MSKLQLISEELSNACSAADMRPLINSLVMRPRLRLDQLRRYERSEAKRFRKPGYVMTATDPHQGDQAPGKPKVSVIIISYNMAREVPRTVQSFLPPYQRGLEPGDVEVIVLENGSPHPIAPEIIAQWPESVRYINIENPEKSPAKALNYGAEIARADVICPLIDGARMASPGLLQTGLSALRCGERTFAATIGFHIGRKLQQIAVTEGYNQEKEDHLIASIEWPKNGYRLFDIAAPAGSSRAAWFGAIAETNAPILTKKLFEEVGGYDERFNIPGGGLVNLDFLNRVVGDETIDYFLLMGEATFHQFHGGVTTSRHVQLEEDDGETTWSKYVRQYEAIRGEAFSTPSRKPMLFGSFPREAAEIARRGIVNVMNAG